MPLIGIDLGTTNSLVCTWVDSQARLIPNALGKFITPSVVSFDDKHQDLIIGQAAKERLVSHPTQTVACFKRTMGSQHAFSLGKKVYTPTELSALVLKQLKADAEAWLGEPVSEAIISVPAYFSDAQRNATKLAGELAGLKVDRLINEPTAAALAYGLNEKDAEQLFMVIDLGGGTLDVSILDIFDNVIEVRASAGDNYLGGEDFGLALMDHFADQHNFKLNALNGAERSRLASQIDQAKHTLTAEHSADVHVELQGKSLQSSYTRAEFENIVRPLIKRFVQPIERALRDSKTQASELDNVILVGGATRMPWVRTEVTRLFRRLPASHINPDEVIALGTAVQAALKSRNEAFEDVVLTDVCPYTLGVDVAVERGRNSHESGHFLPIIERNMTVPVSREQRLHTLTDNQDQIHCEIFQGESRLTKNNISIGSVSVEIPRKPAGHQYVDVRFTYDINGILEVIVKVGGTDEEKRVVINNADNQLSQEDIEASLKKLDAIKIHPREDAKNRELIAKVERLYEEYLGENREYLSHVLIQFESALNTQDPEQVEQARSQVSKIVEQFEKYP